MEPVRIKLTLDGLTLDEALADDHVNLNTKTNSFIAEFNAIPVEILFSSGNVKGKLILWTAAEEVAEQDDSEYFAYRYAGD